MLVVLKSKYNSKYLEYVKDEGQVQGYVRCSGEDVHSPLSKFEVERTDSDSKVVHLRCCYNNKYLVASTQQSKYIVAEADKPEEDQSKSSCTLFQIIPFGDDYRFKHVNSGNYAVLMRLGDNDPKKNCLYAGWADPNADLCDVFTVIDWKSLVVLPQYVAFKGDNGNYLCAYLDNHNYLKFARSDSGDSTAAHEVFPTSDGSIRLKSTHFGQFWRRSPNWIWADSSDTSTNNKDTLFWPVKLDDKTIALRNLGNNQFCKRLTADGNESCLNAATSTISQEARLEVTELVLSRDIYNVHFHPARARIYNEHVAVMGSGEASNTTNKENSMDVKVAHVETESSSWNASVSVKLGVKTTLVTKVPFIAEGKVEISAEVSSGYQWGEVHTKTNTIETVYKALVPPMTRTTVSAIGSTATCDVPYSYTQTDTLMDGTQRTYDKEDGLYTGVNSFNVTYELKNEKI